MVSTVQVPTRFNEAEIAQLDALVRDGVGATRSEVIRIAFANLVEWHRRTTIGQAIAASYTDQPQSEELDRWAVTNAIALTEAEAW